MSVDSWTITCPFCGFEGGDQSAFRMNMTDECWCPKCRERFEFEYPEDEDDEGEIASGEDRS
ncbi:hypothetical protein [Tautonia plasticadhaerens]|uniref:Uncharacterized protein n=1 Tax=Tautonia plasticadhaerens TaxID=2527974 RepID=A0A518H3S1_9BACT|nr:hypothetical protein [Tautonia plasticadhaerens]QDV35480.1 hypothetical protein ElP_33830 [Tautonia plasticadhaerens]